MTVPTSKRRREVKLNNSRRVLKSEIEYYDSKGEYATKKWDNPLLRVDSLVEVTDNAMIAPNEVNSMLVDDDNITRGSRRFDSKNEKVT